MSCLVLAALAVLARPAGPSPSEIWMRCAAVHRARANRVQRFRTVAARTGALVYSGSVRPANRGLELEFTDHEEGCRAGETWLPDGSASTWVSPADLRGYNDTVGDRHPSLLLRLARGERLEHLAWRVGVREDLYRKRRCYVIEDGSGVVYRIDRATYALVLYRGVEQTGRTDPLVTALVSGRASP